jgi:hypothetical protein
VRGLCLGALRLGEAEKHSAAADESDAPGAERVGALPSGLLLTMVRERNDDMTADCIDSVSRQSRVDVASPTQSAMHGLGLERQSQRRVKL